MFRTRQHVGQQTMHSADIAGRAVARFLHIPDWQMWDDCGDRVNLDVRVDERHAEPVLPTGDVASCPFHAGQRDREAGTQKTLVLTGASRGIGHAAGKLFSEAGWRIITCSRQPFDGERCPWDAGSDNHVQIELGDHRAMPRGIAELKARLAGAPLHALINNARDLAEGARR